MSNYKRYANAVLVATVSLAWFELSATRADDGAVRQQVRQILDVGWGQSFRSVEPTERESQRQKSRWTRFPASPGRGLSAASSLVSMNNKLHFAATDFGRELWDPPPVDSPGSSVLSVAALGDSLTDEYAGFPHGAAGDRNWVEQLRALRATEVIINLAVAGATSSSLLAQRQQTAAASLVRAGMADVLTLIVGTNDAAAFQSDIFADRPEQFISTVTANIETALDTAASAGDVSLVLGNIADVGVTPLIRSQWGHSPVLRRRMTEAVSLANEQIEADACARGVPVVDLFGLVNLTQGSITLGGVTVSRQRLYTPDGIHLSTVWQGLLANTVLEAIHVAHGVEVDALRLSDQEILTLANIPHPAGQTYFDVSPFVIFEVGS